MTPPSPAPTVHGPGPHHVTCRDGETLLDAWLRSGVAAQFSCRGGSCHTCLLRCTAGELPARAQLGLPEHLQRKGYFLPCLCLPTGPLQVADVVADDFVTECLIESHEATADGWLLRLEPITAYPAQPGQRAPLRLDADEAAPWHDSQVLNRQEEDFYLHLLLAQPDAALRDTLAGLAAGTSVYLRPAGHPDTIAAQATAPQAAPDLWEELGQGSQVREVLEDFYTRVFADPILAPFFRNVTQAHVTGKQYAFLHDEMKGRREAYFGDNVRNVHHWMVISDQVFDHRQRLMETVLRDHGLSEDQVARWMHFEERHKGDIVKEAPWPREFAGITLPDGYAEETLSCGAMCDHCGREVHPGETVLYHQRLGTISCSQCRPGNPGPSADTPATGT